MAAMNRLKKTKKRLVAAEVVLEAHILVHIADGVNMDQGANPADHHHHGDREGVHPEGPAQVEFPDGDPIRQVDGGAFRVAGQGDHLQDRDHKSQTGGCAGDGPDGFLTQLAAEDDIDQQPDDGEEDDPGHKVEEIGPGCCDFGKYIDVSGYKGIQNLRYTGKALSFQTAHLVNIDAVLGAEDGHDQGQTNGYFCSCDRHHKEDKDLSA